VCACVREKCEGRQYNAHVAEPHARLAWVGCVDDDDDDDDGKGGTGKWGVVVVLVLERWWWWVGRLRCAVFTRVW